MVRAFGDALDWDFGQAKYTFDLIMIALSIGYGMFRAGHIVGIGVGTVVAALLTGRLCRLFSYLLSPWFARCLPEKE